MNFCLSHSYIFIHIIINVFIQFLIHSKMHFTHKNYLKGIQNYIQGCIFISFLTFGFDLLFTSFGPLPSAVFAFLSGPVNKTAVYCSYCVFNSLLSSFLSSAADNQFLSPPFLRLLHSLIFSIVFDPRDSCQHE